MTTQSGTGARTRINAAVGRVMVEVARWYIVFGVVVGGIFLVPLILAGAGAVLIIEFTGLQSPWPRLGVMLGCWAAAAPWFVLQSWRHVRWVRSDDFLGPAGEAVAVEADEGEAQAARPVFLFSEEDLLKAVAMGVGVVGALVAVGWAALWTAGNFISPFRPDFWTNMGIGMAVSAPVVAFGIGLSLLMEGPMKRWLEARKTTQEVRADALQ